MKKLRKYSHLAMVTFHSARKFSSYLVRAKCHSLKREQPYVNRMENVVLCL